MDEEFDSFEVDEVEVFDEPMEVETFDEPIELETFDEPVEIEQDFYEPAEIDDINESMDLDVETIDDTTEVDEDSLIIDEAMSITDDIQDNDESIEVESSEDADISLMDETEDSDPMQDMMEYMSEHNYGRDDYETYSKDPEYQAINDRLLEADGQEPLDYGSGDADFESELSDNVVTEMDEATAQDYIEETLEPDEVPDEVVNDVTEEPQEELPEGYEETIESDEVPDEVVNDITEEPQEELPEGYEETIESDEVPDEVVNDITEEPQEELPEGYEETLEPDEVPDEVVNDVTEEPQEELPEGYEETIESDEVPEEAADDVTEEQQDELQEGYEETLYSDGVSNEIVEDSNDSSEVLDDSVLVANPSDTTENIEDYEVPGDFSNAFETDAFEEQVRLDNPEFYETGSFYEQGVNEFGYEGTCGPTSQANAINALFGTNEFTENKVLSVAIENDLCETTSLNPADNGGTTTDQFMELYGKINEKIDGKLNVERYDFENALSVSEMADKLDEGAVLNIAVDADTLWDVNNHIPGIMGQDKATDHWITVTGVDRNPDGSIAGFKLIDSGGGVDYADVDKYERMCFGEPGREMLDPTCIVVSKNNEVSK